MCPLLCTPCPLFCSFGALGATCDFCRKSLMMGISRIFQLRLKSANRICKPLVGSSNLTRHQNSLRAIESNDPAAGA